MTRQAFIEVYEDSGGQFRWRKVAANGKRTSNPGEGYSRRWNAKRAARREHPGVEIRDA